MAEYAKLYKKAWTNPRLRGWSDDEKLLWLYLLSSPHSNCIGFYVLPKSYIAEDLNWTQRHLEKPLAALSDKGFVAYDDSSRTVLIPSWFEHNKIANDNHCKKAAAELSEIPFSPLIEAFAQVVKRLPDGLHKRLLDGLPERYGNQEEEEEEETVTEEEPRKASPSEISKEATRLANLLANLILHRDPKAKTNPALWAADLDKLNRLDGREWSEIEAAIRWVQADGPREGSTWKGWQSVILSGKSLREKFTKLVAQMGEGQVSSSDPWDTHLVSD